MEGKAVIKRILIAVIVVLIGAVCITGFLALKHNDGGSWDVLLVFGIKCTSMSSFWRFMIIYFIISELLILVSAYLAARVVGCFGDTSIGATISVIIAIVGVIALAGVVSWKAVGYVDSQVEGITIMLWGKILFVILSLLQASFQTMIKLDNF